jgi:ankyrin repeat protein
LAISSSGHLPNILAQHLFTSFIWTVVEHLPEDCIRQSVMGGEQDVEIEGRHTFDPHEFVDTWRRPTLRHRQLTKLVRQLETFGLGSQTEVLLCMIPAFSFKDLLPNHVILKLIPQIRRGQGWAETARCYNRLLEQGLRVSPHGAMAEEKLCYNVVVATIDFLSFASEPYDEHIKAPDELRDELEDIVARLVSTRFAPVIKKLAQAYILQRRNEDIGRIFGLLGTSDSFERLAGHKQLRRLFDGGHDLDGCLKALRSSEQKPDFPFLEKSLNFSKPHRAIYEALSGRKVGAVLTSEKSQTKTSLERHESIVVTSVPRSVCRSATYSSHTYSRNTVDAARTRDIFDWTPLHYASFLKERELLFRYFDPKQVKKHLSLHKELGPFGRSPIHMAAISGSPAALQWISRCLGSKENKRNAYDTTGTDGMSPLHLATKSGHADLAAKIIRKQRLRTTTGLDFWGRAAIHLAASHGHDEIAELLLGEDSQIDTFDEIGKTPLDYLVKIHEELRDAETKDDTQDGEKKDDNCEEETGKEEHDSADADKRDAEDPNPQTAATEGGKLAEQKRAIFVEFAEKSLKNPLHRDKRGKTYLHHAVEHTNIATIEKLLSMGYDLETKDSTGLTPLLFAFAASRPKIALKLLNGFPNLEGRTASALVKDTQENTPLMLAAESGYIDVVRVLIGLSTAKLQGQEGDYPNEDVGPVELSGNYTALKAQGSTYGPLVRNTHGQTALHIALVYGEVEVATYLLHGIDEVQSDPNDGIGNTLLLAAVRNPPVSACIPTIVEKWPSIINQPDSSYGQTPLSWACEAGAESVVDLLLTYEDLDVNKSASNWRNSTPLHFAVGSGRLSIVQKLLSNEKIIVSSKDDSGETAIDRAAKGSDAEIMHELLNHHQIDSTIRLNFLFVTCRVGHPNIQEIVSTVLKQIDDAEITDKDLLELINTSEDLRSSAPYTAFVERAFSRDTWKSMDQPYHKAVRFGSLDYVRRLKEYARDSAEVDEDGWSSIEYANTYRSTNVDAGIVDLLSQQPPQKPELSSLNKPGMLYYPKFANSIQVNACEKPDHGECLGSHSKTTFAH